ncbi:hypothetical protein MLD38_023197 [Melastoma candidum]|uniref:Uncharacterized protein n=1 Tax=Melastoma candidum TaxID=119954 RepID=A0ACB9QMA5_9MYRT|nr:hypothetical protein MLD38_023197 [Melastoma candidum]
MGDGVANLPPGFQFYPTDEELIVHFLHRKALLLPCHPDIIPDLGLYLYEPWELQGKAWCGGSKWYFYSRRTVDRVTRSGYWEPVCQEEPVFTSSSRKQVGFKQCYAFHYGESPHGIRTSWTIHEYRLSGGNSSTGRSSRRKGQKIIDPSTWVLCRVFDCDDEHGGDSSGGVELSCLDEVFLSLDDDEVSFPS